MKMLQGFITTLRKANDPYINQVMDYAEGCSSTIHVYTFSRSEDLTSSTKSHLYRGDETLEGQWQESPVSSGLTLSNNRMKIAGQADIILNGRMLDDPYEPLDLLVLLDELHHAFHKGDSEDAHVQLYTYLLEALRNGELGGLLDIGIVQQKLAQALQKIKDRGNTVNDGPATPASDDQSGSTPVKPDQD
jgi:hypothetical protein